MIHIVPNDATDYGTLYIVCTLSDDRSVTEKEFSTLEEAERFAAESAARHGVVLAEVWLIATPPYAPYDTVPYCVRTFAND